MSTQKSPYWRSLPRRSQNPLPPKNTKRHSNRWWAVSLLLAVIIGGILGYFSLPSAVHDIVHPGYSLSAEEIRLFAVGGGCMVFLILMTMLNAEIDTIRQKGHSRLALFWGSAAYLTAAIVGSLFGSWYLPHLLLAFARILLGASFGIFGLGLLIALFAHPQETFMGILEGIEPEGCVSGCLEGCFSFVLVAFHHHDRGSWWITHLAFVASRSAQRKRVCVRGVYRFCRSGISQSKGGGLP